MNKLLLFLLIISTTISNAQLSDWISSIDSMKSVNDIVVDDSGYAYLVGGNLYDDPQYTSRSSISINGGIYRSPNINSNWVNYVAKIDSAGNLIWARMMSAGNHWYNGNNRNSYNIEIDNNGDLLIATSFRDTLIIENNASYVFPFSGSGEQKLCLTKYDVNGNYIWSNVLPGKYISFSDIEIDQNNDYFIRVDSTYYPMKYYVIKCNSAGSILSSTSYFDRGINSFEMDLGNNVLTGGQHNDTILKQFDLSGNNINTLLASEGWPYTNYIEVDDNGDIYAMGSFSSSTGKMTVGSHSISGFSNFILKLDSNLSVIWLKGIGGYTGWFSDMDIFGDNIYVTGTYWASMTYDTMTYVSIKPPDSLSTYIMKIDGNGNLVWAKYIEGIDDTWASGITRGPFNNLYVTFQTESDTAYLDHLKKRNKNLVSGTFYPYSAGMIAKIIDATNMISGSVFVDSNLNSTPDTNDRFFPWQFIELNGKYRYMTNNYGYYSLYVPPGNYTVTMPTAPRHHTSSPASHSAAFTGVNGKDTSNHFIVNQIPSTNDLQVFGVVRPVRPNYNRSYMTLIYKNVGTKKQTGTVTLAYDPRLKRSGGNPISWNFQDLAPYESRRIYLQFDNGASIKIGDTLISNVLISPINGDADPTDNTDWMLQPVKNSWDPNDKQVQPEGPVLPKYVQDENYFVYTIRFQNTGNDTAFYVRIRDTIYSELEIETFEMIAASHDYRVELTNNNVIDFIFDPISLPDSNVNEEESHGFVKFRIKADPTLKHGDYIDNIAYIYFDSNEPVITNTPRVEISDWASVKEEDLGKAEMLVVPNPTHSDFRLLVKNWTSENAVLTIADISGRIVYTNNRAKIQNGQIAIQGLKLNKGVYTVSLQKDDVKNITKLVVY